MFIVVSTRDCRAACNAALEELNDKKAADRESILQKSYDAILGGAVHNGLKPSPSDLDKIREMATRDVEHMMETHPAVELIQRVARYRKMLDYTKDTEVVIDHEAFELIGSHLASHADEVNVGLYDKTDYDEDRKAKFG